MWYMQGTSVSRSTEQQYMLSQWQLIWLKFRRHRLAVFGICLLIVLYVLAIGAEFFSTYEIEAVNSGFIHAPPQRIHFRDSDGNFCWPFVYGLERSLDRQTMRRFYKPDLSRKYPIRILHRSEPYKLLGLFEMNTRLFGVDEPSTLFLFGTDNLGRDLYSRTIHALRISLSVGLIGVFLSFVLGCVFGGISGYYGGKVDMVIQRVVELLISLPTIPLWMALSAALPPDWPPLRVYLGITVILSLVGWAQLARVVRGKLIESREQDFVTAAKIAGATDGQIIARHLIPSFMSYLIVHITLAIPGMILGETALSFLGLGLRPPVVSLGTLLHVGQNFRTVALYPWILIPAIFVIVIVLAFNFVGDGLRDAADPYT
jgi:peptide/nickel transport system permease protein